MTDNEYISAFRSNDQKAITAFYSACQRDFLRLIGNKFHLVNHDILLDIYQESVCRLWENIQRGKLTADALTRPLAAYLYGIGELVTLEHLRKEKEVTLDPDWQIEDADETEQYYRQQEQYQAVREAVNRMGKPCAPLLIDFYWEGYSMDDIAFRNGYSNANSAKTQKNKCMNKLKAILKQF